MVSCNFCAGKSEKDYLYLTCNHLACLSCAFLRTDFVTQEIACCDRVTRIEEGSMETIIRSKRHIKGFEPSSGLSKYSYKQQSKPVESNLKQEVKIEIKEDKDRQLLPQKSKLMEKKSSEEVVSYIYELPKQNDQSDELEVENVLMRQLEISRRYFDVQRQQLKQREQAAIRQIISVYQTERKNIEKPITQAVLQKFTHALSQKSKRSNLKDEHLKQSQGKQIKDSRENYDHILKRLEVNQQRMKEKMQKHMNGSY